MTKKALIICGGWEGHHPKETSGILRAQLEAEGFSVNIHDSLESLADGESLKTFDLIIPNWTMGQISGDQQKGLHEAVLSGVGMAGCHGGMGDAFRSNTEYQFMVGGQFVAHPDNIKNYEVQIIQPEDPIVSGILHFTVRSEQYYMHVDPSNRVLATTTFQTESAPWVNGTVMPVIWTRKYGAGRVFYNSVGHAPEEYSLPEIRAINTRGMLWAAR